jgi:hypothetical protein
MSELRALTLIVSGEVNEVGSLGACGGVGKMPGAISH